MTLRASKKLYTFLRCSYAYLKVTSSSQFFVSLLRVYHHVLFKRDFDVWTFLFIYEPPKTRRFSTVKPGLLTILFSCKSRWWLFTMPQHGSKNPQATNSKEHNDTVEYFSTATHKNTLQEHQIILTNATISKVSDQSSHRPLVQNCLRCLEEIGKCVSKLILQKNILYYVGHFPH